MQAPDDPITLFEAGLELAKNAAEAERKYERVTRKLFRTDTGREWLRLALYRANFMGSVFADADGMNPTAAAYRDGGRAVFSDILNCAATPPAPNDD